MSLREEHRMCPIVADEGSAGSVLAYCSIHLCIVGVWIGSSVAWDDEPEYGPPEPPPNEHPMIAWARQTNPEDFD